MFNKIRKWLSGEFECIRCGEVFHIMAFGTGKALCPSCYDIGEFLFPDYDFVLNRVWGLVPLKEITDNELAQFIEELSDAVVALSVEGFEVIYELSDAPEEPVLNIRRTR